MFHFPTLNKNINQNRRTIFNFKWNIEKNNTSRFNPFSVKKKEYFKIKPIGGVSEFG